MVLVANNDLLNLDTWAHATGPNGPCGAAACFTQSQVTGCSSTTRARFVIGQIVGASNYDIGHLGLGQPGGGVANLGVVGRSNKAGGCTGIPTPVGDFYAVDYVAHEMGHQFSGNHTFNGNQLNCSGGNRNAANSVEPGSGSSIMAYAGICQTDDLQPHSDPYFSQRSQQEISTYVVNQAAINEVQTASLRHFGGGNEVQVVTFGPGYPKPSTVQPFSLEINAAPSATSRGGAEEKATPSRSRPGTRTRPARRHGDDRRRRRRRLQRHVHRYRGADSRSFRYTNPTTGLPTSGGGTVTLTVPGATESGKTVTISTAAAHVCSVGRDGRDSGVGVAGYTGRSRSGRFRRAHFQYTAGASGPRQLGRRLRNGLLAVPGQDRRKRLGRDRRERLPLQNREHQAAINGIAGLAGRSPFPAPLRPDSQSPTAGRRTGIDVPSIELVNLSCGGCFAFRRGNKSRRRE